MAAAIVCAAVVVFGIIGDCMESGRDGWGMLVFYTVDSNMLAQLACLISGIFEIRCCRDATQRPPRWSVVLLYCAACCMTVTFIVVVLVLAPMMGGFPAGYYNMVLAGPFLFQHLLCPVLTVVALFAVRASGAPDLMPHAPRWALLPTVVYAVAAIVANLAGAIVGPYPFLRVYAQPVWQSVLWCCLILGFAWLIAGILYVLSGKAAGADDEARGN